MDIQEILVCVIIAMVVTGAARYGYRKIKALRKIKDNQVCHACPLKDGCGKMKGKKKVESSSCCS